MHNTLSPARPQLRQMKESALYIQMYLAMTTPWGMLLTVVLLAGAPILNLWIFSCTVFCYFFVDWQLLTHKKNRTLVPDPFVGYFPEDDLCDTLEKRYTTLKLSIKGSGSALIQNSRVLHLTARSTSRCSAERLTIAWSSQYTTAKCTQPITTFRARRSGWVCGHSSVESSAASPFICGWHCWSYPEDNHRQHKSL